MTELHVLLVLLLTSERQELPLDGVKKVLAREGFQTASLVIPALPESQPDENELDQLLGRAYAEMGGRPSVVMVFQDPMQTALKIHESLALALERHHVKLIKVSEPRIQSIRAWIKAATRGAKTAESLLALQAPALSRKRTGLNVKKADNLRFRRTKEKPESAFDSIIFVW